MVVSIESVQGAPGGEKTREWFKKWVARTKKATGVDLRVMTFLTPKPGQNSRYTIEASFDTLAAWADYMRKVQEDAELQGLIREGFRAEETRCFVYNTYARALYQVV